MNETDIYRDSALHIAAKKGHEKIISFLLNKCDENRETALHIAVYKGNQGIFRLLLAAPGQNNSTRNRLGCTALHIAAECYHKPIIKQLLALPISTSMLQTSIETLLFLSQITTLSDYFSWRKTI